jgi:hypothetical protein
MRGDRTFYIFAGVGIVACSFILYCCLLAVKSCGQ